MTYDIYTRVSNNQSLIGVPLAVSTSSINLVSGGETLRIAGRDISLGAAPKFRVHITEAFDAGSGPLSISVAFTADATLLSGAFVPSLVIPNASLIVGAEFDVDIPTMPKEFFPAPTGSLFIGLLYTPTVTPSAGALSAWMPLGHSPGMPKVYSGNYTGP